MAEPGRAFGWLPHAYPRRWQAAHGEELVAVLLDCAPSGATRPDLGTVVDVVRSGWAVRWRGRPPLWRWLLYRVFGRRLPVRWRPWVEDDIEGRWFPLREALLGLAIVVPVLALFATDVDAVFLTVIGVAVFAGRLGLAGSRRRMARQRHLDVRVGRLVDTPPVGTGPRRRLVCGPWLAASGAVAGLVAASALLAAGATGAGPAALGLVVGAGPGAGAVLGAAGGARARRRRPMLPPQPDRWLVTPTPPAVAAVLTAMVVLVIPGTLAVGDAAGAAGSAVALAAAAGAAAAVLLFAADRAARRAWRDGTPLAVVDLWRLAFGSGAVPVDRPVPVWDTAPFGSPGPAHGGPGARR